ncbi:glycosyltransferase family 2 protein [Anaeromicropila herbilytica]|uniref:Glycosyl transferase n=1 Tax=Anaeromicropila herbilytica TaxID=2785025 RepID=A0A7R7EP76_9FIRM|nr:glycosyltransferase [Anaeromicropila herbilytica]BCN32545.1 glycosyl transferase [Anaeromicropila herbilytica]
MFTFKDKLVSVIMPAFNTEKYIREAIESILNQTYKNLEFIIIDDGSTDNTLKIIMEYAKKDNRILVISRKNMGLTSSLNDGIKLAHGEYIARMDSDDISATDRFEKQVSYMNQNPDIYLLGTNFNMIYEENISEAARKRYASMHKRSMEKIDKDNVLLSINEAQKFIHPTIMLRREVFDIVGLYREYKIEDMELYFRIAAYGLGVAKIEENLLDYRAREDSKSWTDSRKIATAEIMKMKLEYLSGKLEDITEIKRYMIWGADISGSEALELLKVYLPNSICVAYIDPYKVGEKLNDLPIIDKEEISNIDHDYIFICTQAGAKPSREYLKSIGEIEILNYFKIS